MRLRATLPVMRYKSVSIDGGFHMRRLMRHYDTPPTIIDDNMLPMMMI